jgi:hypothetical protein
MGLPTFGTMYLRSAQQTRATFHRTLYCDTLIEVVKRSAKADPNFEYDPSLLGDRFEEVDIGSDLSEWDWASSTPRRFCRVCALEHVMSLALKRIDDEPVSTMTISPWPALPENRNRAPELRTTERAAERMSRLAEQLNGYIVPAAVRNAAILVVEVPDRALELVHRNFWAIEPPAAVTKTPEIISSAWSLFLKARDDADPMSAEDIWDMAEAAHQKY